MASSERSPRKRVNRLGVISVKRDTSRERAGRLSSGPFVVVGLLNKVQDRFLVWNSLMKCAPLRQAEVREDLFVDLRHAPFIEGAYLHIHHLF